MSLHRVGAPVRNVLTRSAQPSTLEPTPKERHRGPLCRNATRSAATRMRLLTPSSGSLETAYSDADTRASRKLQPVPKKCIRTQRHSRLSHRPIDCPPTAATWSLRESTATLRCTFRRTDTETIRGIPVKPTVKINIRKVYQVFPFSF